MEQKKRKKLFKREILLEKLLETSEVSAQILLGLTLEFFDFAIAMAQPGSQAAQRALRKQTEPRHIHIDLKSRMAFHAMLSKLKKENLIARNEKNEIKITNRGKEYLQQKQEKPFKLTTNYKIEKFSDKEKIILFIFDIPERERNKRAWVRFYLKKFGFHVLQKSVWWGRGGIPKEFIKDLKKYDLLPHVHIFSVKDEGTISSIIQTT